MSEPTPAPALGAQQAIELDEIRERAFQRAKMYLLANGLSDPSQLPAEYTDPARLLKVIADQAALVAEWQNEYRRRQTAVEIERDQARASLAEHRIAYTALVGERDEQRKDTESWYRQAQVLNAESDRLEQRAERLAALEEAAERWYREAWDTWQPGDGHAAEEALMHAVVALLEHEP